MQHFSDNRTLFLSASKDSTLKVWSIETLSMLYTFDFPSTFSFVRVMPGAQTIVTQNQSELTVNQLHFPLSHYLRSESRINQILPCFKSISDQTASKVNFTISLCEDNSAIIKNVADNQTPKSTLYPPPSAQLIAKVVYSQVFDRVITLLSSSALCVYKRQKETALLEKVWEHSELKDSEGRKALGEQSISSMELVQVTDLEEFRPFDTEVL
jgi:WD40 repeat protein